MFEAVLMVLSLLTHLLLFYCLIYVGILRPLKRKKTFKIFNQKLFDMGFNANQCIITTYYQVPTNVGIWVDYKARKLAVRTSHMETDPNIYEFGDIRGFQATDGAGGVITEGSVSGFGVGIGMFGVGSGSINMRSDELVRDIFVRLSYGGGEEGVNAIQIPIWKSSRLGGPLKASLPRFQALLECRRAICDELKNIMQMQ